MGREIMSRSKIASCSLVILQMKAGDAEFLQPCHLRPFALWRTTYPESVSLFCTTAANAIIYSLNEKVQSGNVGNSWNLVVQTASQQD